MRSRMSEPAADLIAEDLACRRGERLVFTGLSFRLPPGGALVLTGTNGSGKTSLLRLLAELDRVRPRAGSPGAGRRSQTISPGIAPACTMSAIRTASSRA